MNTMNGLKELDKVGLLVGGVVLWYFIQNIVFKDSWRKRFSGTKKKRLLVELVFAFGLVVFAIGLGGFAVWVYYTVSQSISVDWRPAKIESWNYWFLGIGTVFVVVLLIPKIKKIKLFKNKSGEDSSEVDVDGPDSDVQEKPKEAKKK